MKAKSFAISQTSSAGLFYCRLKRYNRPNFKFIGRCLFPKISLTMYYPQRLIIYATYLFPILKYLSVKKKSGHNYFKPLSIAPAFQYTPFHLLNFISVETFRNLKQLSLKTVPTILSNFHSGTLKEVPLFIAKVITVIIINPASVRYLSIVTSILCAVYDKLKQIDSKKVTVQVVSVISQINPYFVFNAFKILPTPLLTKQKNRQM